MHRGLGRRRQRTLPPERAQGHGPSCLPVRLLEPQPSRQLVQVAGIQPERACGLCPVVLVDRQRGLDVPPLAIGHGVAQGDARGDVRDASGGSPAGEGGATAWASRSSSPVSSVTMSSRLAPRLSILSAARLTTCSSSRTFPGQG